jgi:hypothetical protein
MTQQVASSEAVQRCSTKASDCQVVVVAKNGCVALAGGRHPLLRWYRPELRSG